MNLIKLKCFQTLCWCFESGITLHLTRNERLRQSEWFGLGAIKPQLTSLDRDANARESKLERQVAREYENKVRDSKIKRNRMHRADDHYYD